MAYKRRSKSDVVKKEPFSRGNKKNGKGIKSGTVVHFNDGTSTMLLTPAGRAEKFAGELKTGTRVRCDGSIVKDEYGYPVDLTKEQRAFRSGYLTARQDNAKAFKAKKGNK